MSAAIKNLPIELRSKLRTARSLESVSPARWCTEELKGRLVEVAGLGSGAGLSVAVGRVRAAQAEGETVAWVCGRPGHIFPPDLADAGVDLKALPVVKLVDAVSAGRAATTLLRSGAFGLVVLDLGEAKLPTAIQARLLRQAQTHGTAVLCLTDKGERTSSLGSMVSLRLQVVRNRVGEDRFACEIRALKDKRRGPRWQTRELCAGVSGLR